MKTDKGAVRVAEDASGSDRVFALLLVSAYGILNGVLRTIRFVLWPGVRPSNPKTVCVYRVGNMGDTICAYPALSAIRRAYPKATLVLLTTPGRRGAPGAKGVFADVPWIDEIVEYFPEEIRSLTSFLALMKSLRRYRFDVFIELSNDLARMGNLIRNMVFARFAGAGWGGGWSVNTLRIGLQRQSRGIQFPNEVERVLRDVESCGISVQAAEFTIPVTHEQDNRAREILAAIGVPVGKQVVALAPGAKRPANRWPTERFAEVGRDMTSRGFYVVIVGSAADREMGESIRSQVGDCCANAAGLMDVAGAMALVRLCVLLICNDSGLQHAASAVGTPCVSVFSARDLWGKWRPHHPESRMLRKMVPCHTCYVEDCPNGNRCLVEILPAEVMNCALTILTDMAEAQTPLAGA